jgi:GntR family transcriptional regulator
MDLDVDLQLGTLPAVEPPEIRPYAADPPYRQIAAWLRARILAGEFSPDVPLPSEKALVGMFGVARETARKAVQLLRDEGLVVIVPHRGAYVVPEDQR